MTDIVCANCREPLRDTSGVDPNVPWVHQHSGNGFCDVFSPADAVELAQFNPLGVRPEADPIPAGGQQ